MQRCHGAKSRAHSRRPAWEGGGRRVRRAEVGEGPAHQEGLVFFLSVAGVALRMEPGGSGQICVGKGHLRCRVEDKLLARVVAEDQ